MPECNKCSGTGYRAETKQIKCSCCKGRGYMKGVFGGTCSSCDGKGWNYTEKGYTSEQRQSTRTTPSWFVYTAPNNAVNPFLD